MKEAEAGTRVDPKSGISGPIVRISDVQKASRESFSSILSKAVAFSTSFEALLLVSLASLTQSTGRHEGGFDINELITKMEAISGGSGDFQYSPPPTFGETLEILRRLGEVCSAFNDHIYVCFFSNLCRHSADSTGLPSYSQELERYLSRCSRR